MEANNISIPTYNFSVAAYHKLMDVGILKEDDKVELIEGQIVTMSPIKSHHAACVDRLGDILKQRFGKKAIIRSQNPIVLGTHSEPEPDLAAVQYKEDYYEKAHPKPAEIFIAIEISQTTEHYDRTIKIPLYAKFGIPEVWLVNLNKKVVEVYQRPKKNTYTSTTIYSLKDKIQSGFIKPLAVKRIIST